MIDDQAISSPWRFDPLPYAKEDNEPAIQHSLKANEPNLFEGIPIVNLDAPIQLELPLNEPS